MKKSLSFILTIVCWLAVMSLASAAQEIPKHLPCRPLGPEDTSQTPAEIASMPFCSPTQPVDCEVALAYLYQLISRVHMVEDHYVIVVARRGRAESNRIAWARLNQVKSFLSERLPNTTVVTATGEGAKGFGKLEFYVGGHLLYVLPYPRNKLVDCSGIG